MFLKGLRFFSKLILKLIARINVTGMEHVPGNGQAVLITSNHIGRLDAMLVFILAERDDIVMFVADKYKQSMLWTWFVKHLDAIWLNREGLDLNAFRLVQRRLNSGEMLAIAPEGTRSQSGTLIPAKPGAAYLAGKANVPIIPISVVGTEDAVVRYRLRRLRKLDITIIIGNPYHLPPYDRKNRDDYLANATDEIMCRIAVNLPDAYHGHYAEHPRLAELQAGMSMVASPMVSNWHN